jgi:hypothetical protein
VVVLTAKRERQMAEDQAEVAAAGLQRLRHVGVHAVQAKSGTAANVQAAVGGTIDAAAVRQADLCCSMFLCVRQATAQAQARSAAADTHLMIVTASVVAAAQRVEEALVLFDISASCARADAKRMVAQAEVRLVYKKAQAAAFTTLMAKVTARQSGAAAAAAHLTNADRLDAATSLQAQLLAETAAIERLGAEINGACSKALVELGSKMGVFEAVSRDALLMSAMIKASPQNAVIAEDAAAKALGEAEAQSWDAFRLQRVLQDVDEAHAAKSAALARAQVEVAQQRDRHGITKAAVAVAAEAAKRSAERATEAAGGAVDAYHQRLHTDVAARVEASVVTANVSVTSDSRVMQIASQTAAKSKMELRKTLQVVMLLSFTLSSSPRCSVI